MPSRSKHIVDPNRSTVHRVSTKPDSRKSKQYNGNKSPYYSEKLSELDAASSDEQTSIPVESNFISSKNVSYNSEYAIAGKMKPHIPGKVKKLYNVFTKKIKGDGKNNKEQNGKNLDKVEIAKIPTQPGNPEYKPEDKIIPQAEKIESQDDNTDISIKKPKETIHECSSGCQIKTDESGATDIKGGEIVASPTIPGSQDTKGEVEKNPVPPLPTSDDNTNLNKTVESSPNSGSPKTEDLPTKQSYDTLQNQAEKVESIPNSGSQKTEDLPTKQNDDTLQNQAEKEESSPNSSSQKTEDSPTKKSDNTLQNQTEKEESSPNSSSQKTEDSPTKQSDNTLQNQAEKEESSPNSDSSNTGGLSTQPTDANRSKLAKLFEEKLDKMKQFLYSKGLSQNAGLSKKCCCIGLLIGLVVSILIAGAIFAAAFFTSSEDHVHVPNPFSRAGNLFEFSEFTKKNFD